MKKTLYILILFTLFAVSCKKDVLDLKPLDIINEQDVFKSESGINSYFARLYSAIPVEDFNYSSDKGFNRNSVNGVGVYPLENLTDLSQNVVEDDGGNGYSNTAGGSYWNYGDIRNVNKFITLLDKYAANFSPDKVKIWKAEAQTIRAWYYFAMVKRFGGVPNIKDVLEWNGNNLEELKIPRNSEKESWDFIIEDLDQAIANLPEDNGTGKINRYVALTLQGQAAITAASIAKYGIVQQIGTGKGATSIGIASDQATTYYRKALSSCEQIISSGHYSLARGLDQDGGKNFAQLFFKYDNHNEDIFVEHYQYPQKVHSWDMYFIAKQYWGGNYSSRLQPTVDLMERYEYRDGKPGTVVVNDAGTGAPLKYANVADIFQGRDFRFSGTVLYPGGIFKGEALDIKAGLIDRTGKKVIENTTIEGVSSRGKGGGVGGSQETQTGLYLRKYIDEQNTVVSERTSDQGWITMRYAEVLLMASEAATELGSNDRAKPWINDIRDRAGLLPLEASQITVENVRKEYISEFAFENVIFWAYKRWRVFDKIITNNYQTRALLPFYDLRDKTWQFEIRKVGRVRNFLVRNYYQEIPNNEISTNPNLAQNPGY